MEKFSEDKIFPDVIDVVPEKILKINYDEGLTIEPGMVVTPTQVQNKPVIHYDGEPGVFYTLIMHDPDAPSRNNNVNGEWQHWLIVNIPENRVSEGELISDYIGAGPPKQTGLHRYIFLLYKQSGQTEFGLPRLSCCTMKGRAKQKVRDMCSRYKLQELVAGNYFMAEWDDYVTELYTQFK